MPKMTTEQFLSQLGIEVGKPFRVDGYDLVVKNSDFNKRLYIAYNGNGLFCDTVTWLLDKEITPLPKYTLTEDVKNIVRVIPQEYKWLGRDYDGIWAFTLEPKFDYDYKDFGCVGGITADLGIFNDYLTFIEENEKVSLDELRKCL